MQYECLTQGILRATIVRRVGYTKCHVSGSGAAKVAGQTNVYPDRSAHDART